MVRESLPPPVLMPRGKVVMGFFKTVTLRRHAEKIAAGFSVLRNQQFESVRRSIEKRVEPQTVLGPRALGGDADLAFKAYQLLIFTTFSIEHRYVAEPDFQEFAGHVNIAVSGADQEQVQVYLLEFGQRQNQLMREIRVEAKNAEDAYGEQVTGIAIPIADYIVPESSPVAWAITARLMPIFALNTQMVVADEFHDQSTLKALQSQMENVRQELIGTTP